ncbi:MAG: hypothetical protein QUV05_14810 [Phycisphaerae bacterium]|nr:hypothetical protein [Phycisphaerae bacterium]
MVGKVSSPTPPSAYQKLIDPYSLSLVCVPCRGTYSMSLTKTQSRLTVEARPPSKLVIELRRVATGRSSQFDRTTGAGICTSPKYARQSHVGSQQASPGCAESYND